MIRLPFPATRFGKKNFVREVDAQGLEEGSQYSKEACFYFYFDKYFKKISFESLILECESRKLLIGDSDHSDGSRL